MAMGLCFGAAILIWKSSGLFSIFTFTVTIPAETAKAPYCWIVGMQKTFGYITTKRGRSRR